MTKPCPRCGKPSRLSAVDGDCLECTMTRSTAPPRTLEEQLADAQHDIWSHWMRWFFDNDTPQNRERWKRQMVTPYAELSESERESDRRVVRQFLGFVDAALREAADGEREKCIEIVGLEAANWPEIGAAILFKVQDLLRQRRMS